MALSPTATGYDGLPRCSVSQVSTSSFKLRNLTKRSGLPCYQVYMAADGLIPQVSAEASWKLRGPPRMAFSLPNPQIWKLGTRLFAGTGIRLLPDPKGVHIQINPLACGSRIQRKRCTPQLSVSIKMSESSAFLVTSDWVPSTEFCIKRGRGLTPTRVPLFGIINTILPGSL